MAWVPLVAGVAATLALVATAEAVIVRSGDANLTPPPDDPGFANVTESGSSMVYLGDSWILTARHVGVPNTVSLDGERYDVIPNTSRSLHNPGGMDLTSEADLRMFRINGNPDLPELEISTSPPPIGTQVMMIGRGREREDGLSNWNVDINGEIWTWTETNGTGRFTGYKILGSETRDTRWGTNRIADEDPIRSESDPDHNTVVEIGEGQNKRQTISLLTLWDEFGGTPQEAQAVAGDSGGGVFYKRRGQWELAGIMTAVLTFPNQSVGWSIFGQATTFADLSIYRDEIHDLMSNPNYSIVGDINLDGVVTGDGTGSPEDDDLSAFISGWLTEHPVANIDSWKLGDLNQDAMTNLKDFALLRGAHPVAAAIAPALGIAVAPTIPEPGSWTLAVIFMLGVWCTRRWTAWNRS